MGIGARGAVFGIGCAVAPYFARLTQTLASSVIDSDYVASARVLGVRRARLLTRHVLPNVAEPLLLTSTLAVGEALLALAGLSFLGLGVQPPTYDWGRMLNEGIGRIYVTPIVAIGPAVAIVLAALIFTLLGETLAKGAAGQQTTARWRGRPGDADAVPEPTARRHRDLGRGHPRRRQPDRVLPRRVRPGAGVSIGARSGEMVGIVGESGSGKTLTAMAIADLLPPSARMTAARYRIRGRDPRELSDREKRKLLGRSLAIVYQDPMSSLNPALRVGRQLGEVAEAHEGLSRAQSRLRSIDGLRAVRIGNPEARLRQYPHEFSGGMRQRAVIAMGLMIEPKLLIADEPTTALDVTVQQQILRLLRDVGRASNSAAVFISHDVAVVSQLCSRVVVMYAGRIVEELDVATLVRGPAHPYTAALVASVPTMESRRDRPLAAIPGRAPGPYDQSPGCPFHPRCPVATDRCRSDGHSSSRSPPGSGSRAGTRSPVTTFASRRRSRPRTSRTCRCDRARRTRDHRSLRTRPAPADGGRRRRDRRSGASHGRPRRRVGLRQVHSRPGACRTRADRCRRGAARRRTGAGRALRASRGSTPSRPDDIPGPVSSLNPRMSVGAAVGEALAVRGGMGRSTRSLEIRHYLDLVHLDFELAAQPPSLLSGGQRQRVAIARALAARPEVLIADDITSSSTSRSRARFSTSCASCSANSGSR